MVLFLKGSNLYEAMELIKYEKAHLQFPLKNKIKNKTNLIFPTIPHMNGNCLKNMQMAMHTL